MGMPWLPILLLVLAPLAARAAPAAADGNLLPNPTFRDEDGDGKVDGWEVKTFIFEKDPADPKRNRLTLKIKQDSDRQVIGEVSTVFQGPEGYYQVAIRYLDENDGISMGKFLVNGKVVHVWDFDNIFFSYYRTELVENVRLKPGDRLAVWAANDGTEYCRLDSVRVLPSPRPPSAKEFEEMKPPAVADAAFGKLVPLAARRELAAEEARPEGHVTVSRGLLLVPARAGERVRLELQPNSARAVGVEKVALAFLGPAATGLEAGEPSPAEVAAAFDAEAKVGVASFVAPAEGLYRLESRQSTPSAKGPHAFACAPQARGAPMLMGAGDFSFFVPRGTKAFAVGASALGGRVAEVTLLFPDGTVCKRTSLEAKEELAVRVPEGRDDAAWTLSVRGVAPAITLRGVPPFVATHPKFLLVPAECLPPSPRP
jgi:hypothetical protein